MALSIGIVGLPNVGKSTMFNALTKAQNAESANYPFCTIEPNSAVVPVPDKRLDKLASIVKPQKVLNAIVEFNDIAGLVKGASKGEGLGNKFLSHIRETSAIVHVVRCFEDSNVVHVDGSIDPIRDVEIINTELMLADLQTLENRMQKLNKQARGDKSVQPVVDIAEELLAHLNDGGPVVTFPKKEDDAFLNLDNEIRFLTNKIVIFAANVDEDGIGEDNKHVTALKAYAEKNGAEVVKLCAKLEEEMIDMSDQERNEFLDELGSIEGSGLDQVIHKGYKALGLISYFTAGPKEVRAWTIQKGWKAPKAASVIHNDFERGFIRAEVISYNDFIDCDGEANAKTQGKMRTEGKDYIVIEGDVVHFLFNV